jgi:hypothetical protein
MPEKEAFIDLEFTELSAPEMQRRMTIFMNKCGFGAAYVHFLPERYPRA